MTDKNYTINLHNPEDSPEKIANKLNTLHSAIDISVIKDGISRTEFLEHSTKVGKYMDTKRDRIDTNDLRWHGAGLSKIITDATLSGLGTSLSPLSVVNLSGITFVENEIVGGSGTTFTLANTPVALSVHVYGRGQRLKLGTNYTISGTTISTTDTWGAGDLIADYRK